MDLYQIRTTLNAGMSIYDIPLRVAFYARVSTEKDEQLHSLSAQIRYYTDFIQKCPNWTLAEGYIDEGLSGTSVAKREHFLKMIDDAKSGQFDFIITKEISRFSRNTMDSIQYTQELLRCGVGVLFQSDNINTLMPDSELRLTIMSSIAQDEVRKISERVRFGFKRAIEQGVVLGNSKIWGYDKRNGRLVVNAEEAGLVQLIFDLYANRQLGIRSIANHLAEHGYKNTKDNDFSFSTIKGILTNPKYKGYYCGGKTHKYDYRLNDRKYMAQDEWVMYKDEEHVPAIVSEELWIKANLLLEKRSRLQSTADKTAYQNKYPYSGKIICAAHQQPYYRALYKYKSGNKEVWQCREYVKKGKIGCKAPMVYTSELDDVMRQSMMKLAIDKRQIADDLVRIYSDIGNASKIQENIAGCKIKMEEIAKRKDKLLDLSIAAHISDAEFTRRNKRFNSELEQLRMQLLTLEAEKSKNRDMAQKIEQLRQIIEKELDFEDGFSIGMIDALLTQIDVLETVDKNRVRLRVQLKALPNSEEYLIYRRRGNTSVCTAQYI